MAWVFSNPYDYETSQLPVPSNGNGLQSYLSKLPANFEQRFAALFEPPGVPAVRGTRSLVPMSGEPKPPYAGEPLSEATKNFSLGDALRTLARIGGGAVGGVPALAAASYFGSTTPANKGEQPIYSQDASGSVHITPYGQNLAAENKALMHEQPSAPVAALASAAVPLPMARPALSAVPMPPRRPTAPHSTPGQPMSLAPTNPGPSAPPGYNPALGNMANPVFSPGLRARQVLDPVTGNMVNDFYRKTLFGSLFG